MAPRRKRNQGTSGTWDSLPEDIKRMIILAYCTGSTEPQRRIIHPRITLEYKYLQKGKKARPGVRATPKGGIITRHVLDWPHNPIEELKPLPIGFDQNARELYKSLWPHELSIEDSRTVRFHPVRDVVYMDHGDLYNLWDFCKKYHSANGAGYGFTNALRPNNMSRFQNGYTLPDGMCYGEIEGFNRIKRLWTTLETLNINGMQELRLDLSETGVPLESIKSVKFDWSITPNVIHSPNIVKTDHDHAFSAARTTLYAVANQRYVGPAISATFRIQDIVHDKIDHFFEQYDDGESGTETDDDDSDNEGHTANAKVKRKKN